MAYPFPLCFGRGPPPIKNMLRSVDSNSFYHCCMELCLSLSLSMSVTSNIYNVDEFIEVYETDKANISAAAQK